MGKDLIIGNATGYNWQHLKYWVRSIKDTGFDGDVVIVGSDMHGEVVHKLSSEGVILHLFGAPTEDGGVETKGHGVPHVERFFYIWTFLQEHVNDYDRVVVTDTRDVIFQRNPFRWLEDKLRLHTLVAAGEGVRYENEPWGNRNLYQAFGPHFHGKMKREFIYNVGVIGGDIQAIMPLMLMIFQMSLGRPIPIVDQAVYNFLLKYDGNENLVYRTTHGEGWAANLGTTIEAVKAGAGDLGQMCKDNATEFAKYNMNYEDIQPQYEEDGTVVDSVGRPYCIVHQWDRVPALKAAIEKRYENA